MCSPYMCSNQHVSSTHPQSTLLSPQGVLAEERPKIWGPSRRWTVFPSFISSVKFHFKIYQIKLRFTKHVQTETERQELKREPTSRHWAAPLTLQFCTSELIQQWDWILGSSSWSNGHADCIERAETNKGNTYHASVSDLCRPVNQWLFQTQIKQ